MVKVFTFEPNGQGSIPSCGAFGKRLKTIAIGQPKLCKGNLEASSSMLEAPLPFCTESAWTSMAHEIP